MSDLDLTPEAVERLAKTLEAFNGDGYTRFKGMTMCERSAATLRALSERLVEMGAERETLTTSSIIEVAVRNPSVMEYMKHWEARAEAAEAALATARADAVLIAELVRKVEALLAVRAVWTDPHNDDLCKSTRAALAKLKGGA